MKGESIHHQNHVQNGEGNKQNHDGVKTGGPNLNSANDFLRLFHINDGAHFSSRETKRKKKVSNSKFKLEI